VSKRDKSAGRTSEVSTGKHYLEDTQTERLSVLEPIWSRLRREAERHVTEEPTLAAFFTANVLRFHSFDHAVSEHLGDALGEPTYRGKHLQALISDAFNRSLALCTEVAEDFEATLEVRSLPGWSIMLQDDGFRGLVSHRVAAWLAHTERPVLGAYLAGRASHVFQVRITLGTTLAGGIVVNPGVSISGDSVIGQGAVLGTGAVVNAAVIGRDARVLPNSVVTSTVPTGAVVAGVPARRIDDP
jgi:serine O-acetyltransferase